MGQSPLKEGDTVLAVYRSTSSSGNVTSGIQYYLQACMDGSRTPQSPEDADYILLVDTHWVDGGTHGDIALFDGVSVVTLNDAKTGEVVMDITTRKDSPYGMITVRGNSYYQQPRMDSLWNYTLKDVLLD